MHWIYYLIGFAVAFAVTMVAVYVNKKNRLKGRRSFEPAKIFLVGMAAASLILLYPLTAGSLPDELKCKEGYAVLLNIFNTIKLFFTDGEYRTVAEAFEGNESVIAYIYRFVFVIMLFAAPAATAAFVLSFFKNLSAYMKCLLKFSKDVYVFSELNDKSLALAESLKKNKPKERMIIFTDVFTREEEKIYEMLERAEKLGAVCFKKDIVTIRFRWHLKSKQLSFFTIGEDFTENINQSLKLIEKYRYCDNTNLYVFSTQLEAELLLAGAFIDKKDEKNGKKLETKIKVRRVNEVQSLINRTLYDDGYRSIFASAYEESADKGKISAVVVGMGRHGTEMTKALSWFCQMDGYEAEINVFDQNKDAKGEFISLCPELMCKKYNGKNLAPEDTCYKITVHSGINVLTKKFDNIVTSLPHVTYIFVCLGNDETNILTAVKLRTILARKGIRPVIQAVVYNSDKKESLQGIKNFKGQDYNIDFIGDIRSSYSEDVIIDSEVEEQALKRHLGYGGTEKDFWQFEYNYNSSVASAIHKKARIKCGIPGAELEPEKRRIPERRALRKLEHRRWNAYMRSEGYVYGGTVKKGGRDDMAKKHNLLVPFGKLPLKEKMKDDV